MLLRRSLLLCAFVSLSVCSVHAQGYLYATGTPQNATSLPIDHGIVDVNNGEIHLEIPIATKTQRGAFAVNEKLIYDSRIWKPVQNGSSSSWQPTNVPGAVGGWTFSSGAGAGTLTNVPVYQTTTTPPPGCPYYYVFSQSYTQYTNWSWTDPNGTVHTFPDAYTVQYQNQPSSGLCNTTNPGTPTSAGNANDASGYSISITNYTNAVISDPQGKTYTPQASATRVIDSNGNYWSVDSNGNLVDTSGLTPVLVSSSGNNTYYDVLGVGGNRQRYTVTTGSVSFNTAFNQSGVSDASGSFNAIQSITLPNGSAYSFTYYSGTTSGSNGELKSMTLPTGGVVTYNYTNFVDAYYNTNAWVSSIVRDGGTTSITPLVVAPCGQTNGCQEQVTVSRPDGNDTVYAFSLDATSVVDGSSWIQNVYELQGRNGIGTTRRSTNTSYVYTSHSSQSGSYLVPASVTSITTLSDTGYASQTTTTFAPWTSLPAEVKMWDFYNATGHAPTTDTLYQYWACELPSSVVVKDGSGNQISSTTYGYDELSPTGTSGVPQHLTGMHGCNLTSQHQWINTSGTTLDQTMTHDDTGALLTSTDPNGTTQYGYDSTHTFVTSATPPTPSSGVVLTGSATYDASTGLPLTQTDPNGAKTVYVSYDALFRATEIDNQDSSGAVVGKATYNYNSPYVGIHQYQNAGVYTDTELMYDGYGRLSRTATYNGSAWYQRDTCYDSSGRPNFQSYAYQGSGWSTPKVCSGSGSGVTTVFDALGRTSSVTNADGTVQYSYQGRDVKTTDVNNVQTVTEIDAFGRTTAVCEISSNTQLGSGGTPATCPTDMYGLKGFATTYAYDMANHKTVVTQGGQVRTFQIDSLNRTVLSAEPEWGATTASPLQGATNFSYAYNGTGLVVTRTRPQANQTGSAITTTTTQYDKLSRPVSIRYSDGTPARTYLYDQSNAWGDNNNVSLGPSKGRLTRHMVNAGNGMGQVFGYDAMGRVTLLKTCRSSTCGHGDDQSNYTYDWAGNQTSASNPVGTFTYGRSVAGEVTSITSSYQATNNPGTLVSNVVNGPNGPISYSYGNSLSQYKIYDNIGRLQGGWVCQNSPSPSFGCGQQPQTYGFYKNQRGSQISTGWDDITGQNTTYGYDEFNRLSSSNYGNGGQTFNYTYDRYGNRWQQNAPQGGPAPMFSFSQANNHADQLQYDAAGNVTNDGVHTYTYDAEGNQIGVDNNQTSQTFYDAMNRRVWIHTNGNSSINEPAFQEIDYDVNGQRLSTWDGASGNLMQAQVYWGSMPLVYYKEGAIHFQHQDWVGSERVTTSATGSTETAAGNYPFGDGLAPSGRDIDPYHYAQLDHNNESGNERAQFRELSSRQGRWMSPDPYDGSYDATNPQSLNRYVYVLNNPIGWTDPTGLETCNNQGCIGTCTPGVADGCVSTPEPPSPPDSCYPFCSGAPPDQSGPPGHSNTGTGGNTTNNPDPNNVFKCAANVATNHSIAGGLHALGIGNNGGVGGFLTNTFGGNTFSGITNLVSTLGSSSSTDQQVLGQMGRALLRGPLQGIPGSFVGASGALAAPGITSLVRGGVIGAAFNAANSSGSLTTLAGKASIVANTGAEFASGVGEAKFVLDAVTYGASLAACYAGVAH